MPSKAPADPAGGISIGVLNSKGDRGIPEFRVIAGLTGGSISDKFEKRTGRTVINWQPHTCRIGKDGRYHWPLEKAYEEMAIRVEADGYQPQIAYRVRKDKGSQQLTFKLAEDLGIAGRVLKPDGQPAVGAKVALAISQQDIVWEGGQLRGIDRPLPEKPGDRWRRPHVVTADAEGRFRLTTEVDNAAVLVIHESGVLELSYHEWSKTPEVRLQPWGKISGQLIWGDEPGSGEEITLSAFRDDYGYPGMIASYDKAITDREGRFHFDRVLPGLVQISRPIKPPTDQSSGIQEVVLEGQYQHAKVAAGPETQVMLGGRGRKVTGKFVGLDSWTDAVVQVHPHAPRVGFGGDKTIWKAYEMLKASREGTLLFRDKLPIQEDGTFTIERMLPGRYQLFLSAPGLSTFAATRTFQIDAEAPGKPPTELDLGEIATGKKPASVESKAD